MNYKEMDLKINAKIQEMQSHLEQVIQYEKVLEVTPDNEYLRKEIEKIDKKKIDPIINATLPDIKKLGLFLTDLDDEIKNTYLRQILSDQENYEEVLDEEIEMLYKIIQDDSLYAVLMKKTLPQALQQANISKEEYEKIIQEIKEKSNTLSNSIDDIFEQAEYGPDFDNPEVRQAFFKKIVNQMIENDKAILDN